jgi:hypothetical protein
MKMRNGIGGEERKLGRALARGLAQTLREWIAGLGLGGALIAGVSIVAEHQHKTALGIVGLVLAGAGVVSGLLGLRADGWRGWLLATGAVAVAIAVFAMLAVRT